MRLDVYITNIRPQMTRSQAKRLIENGYVSVEGIVCKKPSRAVKGDVKVSLEVMPAKPCHVQAENIPLEILYEDEDIAVVNKPAGMVTHPAGGNYSGTLVNALLYHCKGLSGIGGELRPGIVHRLDKGTSGVMVVAKNDFAHANLSAQFKARTVEKRYYALVHGKVPKEEGIIDLPIGRHISNRKKMSVKTRKGRIAETRYKVIKRFGESATFLDIRLMTGRTHQIRVHFSHIGHPLVGDDVYGRAKALKFSRPALHAYKIVFEHPRSEERMEFNSPIPPDIEQLLNNC